MREGDRDRDRDAERETEMERHRETETERQRHTERQTDRDREREREVQAPLGNLLERESSGDLSAITFFLSSSFSMGSTAQQGLASSVRSNLAYLQNPQALHRNGSFSS